MRSSVASVFSDRTRLMIFFDRLRKASEAVATPPSPATALRPNRGEAVLPIDRSGVAGVFESVTGVSVKTATATSAMVIARPLWGVSTSPVIVPRFFTKARGCEGCDDMLITTCTIHTYGRVGKAFFYASDRCFGRICARHTSHLTARQLLTQVP